MKKTKEIAIDREFLIRIVIGAVFLSAATYRMFNLDKATSEMNNLHLSTMLIIPIITFELIIGLMFLFNYQVRKAALSLITFLSSAIVIALIGNWRQILRTIDEIYIFNATPTDLLLHGTYIILIISLIYSKLDRKSNKASAYVNNKKIRRKRL